MYNFEMPAIKIHSKDRISRQLLNRARLEINRPFFLTENPLNFLKAHTILYAVLTQSKEKICQGLGLHEIHLEYHDQLLILQLLGFRK